MDDLPSQARPVEPSVDFRGEGDFSDAQVADELADLLDIETPLGRHCLKLAIANVRKLDAKQKDYGPDAIRRHGKQGVLIRLDDKAARLGTLLEQERNAQGTESFLERSEAETPNFESRLDSWLDASNYGLIGAALETGVELD
jgi:hypothetical protein